MASKNLIAALMTAATLAAVSVPLPGIAQDDGAQAGADMAEPGPADGPMGRPGMGRGFDFAAIDTNGDGKITVEEMTAHRRAGVEGVDADGDGLISESELSASIMARMQKRADAMAAARIAAQDLDGDQKLSAEELVAPPTMEARMFKRLDKDGDGAVSQEEVDAMREAFMQRRHDDDRPMRGKGKMRHMHHQDGQDH